MKKLYLFVLLFQAYCWGQNFNVEGNFADKNLYNAFCELRITGVTLDKDMIIELPPQMNFSLELPQGSYTMALYLAGNPFYQRDFELDRNLVFKEIQTPFYSDLDTITLFAKQKMLTRTTSKLIYQVQDNPKSSFGSALDVLATTPTILIKDNKIELLGKANVVVYIDDKPTYLAQEQLHQFLEAMDGTLIKHIEIMTTPPAKYQANGNSGIINIITVKAQKQQHNAIIGSHYRKSRKNSYGYNASYMFNEHKFALNSHISMGRTSFLREYNSNIYYPNQTWINTSDSYTQLPYLNLKIEPVISVTEFLDIGVNYHLNKQRINNMTHAQTLVHEKTNPILHIPSQVLDYEDTTQQIFSAFTELKLDTLGKKINIDLSYITQNNPRHSSTWQQTQDLISNNPIQRVLESQTANVSKIENYVAKVDIDLPIKAYNFSFGARSSTSKTTNNSTLEVQYFDLLTPNYPLTNHLFSYKESNFALYTTLQKKFFEKLRMEMGLRIEYVQTKGYSDQTQQNIESDYTTLFPSVFFAYDFTSQTILSVSYSKRVEYPIFEALNPMKILLSQYSLLQGNPFLKPSFSNNMELNLTYKNFNSQLSYSKIKDKVTQVSTLDATTKQNNYIWENYLDIEQYSFVQSMDIDVLPWWSSSNNLGLTYQNSKLLEQVPIRKKGLYSVFTSTNSFTLNKKKDLVFSIEYQQYFKGVYQNYTQNSVAFFALSLKGSFLDSKLYWNIKANNIFNARETTTTYNNQIEQRFLNHWDNHYLSFKLNYKFNNSPNKSKARDTNTAELQRM